MVRNKVERPDRSLRNDVQFSISLPNWAVTKLELEAVRRTIKQGSDVYRTDLVREAVISFVETLND